MENSEPGTSASNTLGGEYQVFLSFRGPDTRYVFTDVLYQAMINAGIHVFIADEELRLGEKISGNLLRAIDDSKLYIPIFSKKYASSRWCLCELARMVENTSKSKEDEKVILPIFYDVKPDDVKLETTLYNEDISNLEKNKVSSEDIKKWREALQKVGGTKGWEPEKDSGYVELIRAVVEEVVVRLKTRERQVTKYLVGMEDRIAAINNLLDIDSDRVRLIEIYGMGGIGKTTLAKIIFNQLCPRFGKNCSFLEDVSKTAKSNGLKTLQEKLLCDISYSGAACKILDVDHDINMIGETICKKMLIVLDDVDEAYQIQKLIGEKSLYPGTRILVTTRDKSVLNIRGFKDKFEHYEVVHYEMVQLSDRDAIKLFSRHAFDDYSPPDNYYALSRKIVSTAGGLPLALQAIGSSLSRAKRKIWVEYLDKLEKTPHKDVLAKLRISYDALKPNEQEIFLDIACFFVGENKTNPMCMWKYCKFCPESAIEVLINKCMIKELDDNSLWMHNQFRDLGRVIAKEQCTRLWDIDDIIDKLNSTEIKGEVQALRFNSGGSLKDPIIITSEQIKQFPHIRFLSLCNVNCQGDFTGCLSELKWISWDNSYAISPRPAAAYQISLDYSYDIPARHAAAHCQRFEAASAWHLEHLVVLNYSGFDMTEDVLQRLIRGARKLKVLTLCYNTLIHGMSTFPQNSGLEKLTFSKFLYLKEIDSSIGKLTKLTSLSFESCVELEKLPEQIGELRKLQHLSLRSCDSLRELPDSVLKLMSLTKLDVVGTRITRLPDSIDGLSSLLSVNVSFTLIERLPSTMNKLLCLRTLHLNNCDQIQELPELPRSLTTLQLSSTLLVTVPNLSYLTNLIELALSDGSESVAKSDIIQTCDMQWIESLSSLSKLQFCFSNVCISTIELGSLSRLEELTLHGVDVPAFKQLPSELIVLELYDTRGKQIQLPPLEKETAIVSSSSRELGENKVSRQIEIKFIEDHKSSEGWVHLRDEPGCNELQAPELIDHWRGGAFHLPSSLNMLRKFVLWGCPGVQDIQFVSTMESLLVFSIGGCTSLKRLGGLSNLKNLMELTLNRCWSLQFVEGINELEFLHQLKIDQCGSVERILDPLSSKIPDECSIHITCSGNLPDCDQTPYTWESYREKILRGTETETTDSETETTDSETEKETGDAPLRIVAIITTPQLSSIYQRSDSEVET